MENILFLVQLLLKYFKFSTNNVKRLYLMIHFFNRNTVEKNYDFSLRYSTVLAEVFMCSSSTKDPGGSTTNRAVIRTNKLVEMMTAMTRIQDVRAGPHFQWLNYFTPMWRPDYYGGHPGLKIAPSGEVTHNSMGFST